MLNQRKILFAAATVALTLGVAACGSSNDDSNVPPPAGAPAPTPPPPGPTSEIPPSAGTSVAAFIAFLVSLAASDTTEPLALGSFAAPSDDITEPQPL